MAVFQPHLFSRTKDFINEFATSLQGADDLVLLNIYPAREKPIPGINSKALLSFLLLWIETLIIDSGFVISKLSMLWKPNKLIDLDIKIMF